MVLSKYSCHCQPSPSHDNDDDDNGDDDDDDVDNEQVGFALLSNDSSDIPWSEKHRGRSINWPTAWSLSRRHLLPTKDEDNDDENDDRDFNDDHYFILQYIHNVYYTYIKSSENLYSGS